MYGTKYISAIEAAERWNLSRRRVVALCGGGRIIGAQKAGAYWSGYHLIVLAKNEKGYHNRTRVWERRS